MLIHQGDAPTPRDPEAWGRLSEVTVPVLVTEDRIVAGSSEIVAWANRSAG